MTASGWQGPTPSRGHEPTVDSGHGPGTWVIGFEHLDLDAAQDICCLPIGDDRPPPAMALRYYAADPAATPLIRLLDLAAVLYLPAGLARWKLSPRLGLAERAERALAEFPSAQVVATQLDDRRCWAQLRGTDPVLFTAQDLVTTGSPADLPLHTKGFGMSVPRVVAALLLRYRVSGGLGRPNLGHRLPMDEPILVRVNGRLHAVQVSVPNPGIADRRDALAPRPWNPPHRSRLARTSWRHAESTAGAWMPTLVREDRRAGTQRVDRTMATLCSLLAYAVAAETGRSPAPVGLRQIRYRLGETRWQEDAPLARKRCQDWLYWALWSAGHQIGPPPATPPDELLYHSDYRGTVLRERLAVREAGPDRRRDDPIVDAWTEITQPSMRYASEHVYSDGTSDWSPPSWHVPFDRAWQTAVTLVDATLVRRQGGWPTGTAILVNDRADRGDELTPAGIRAPYWTFDHDRRAVTDLAGYFVEDRRPFPFLMSDLRSDPVLVDRIQLHNRRVAKGPSAP